jgi:hypothetical protein
VKIWCLEEETTLYCILRKQSVEVPLGEASRWKEWAGGWVGSGEVVRAEPEDRYYMLMMSE